MDDDCKKLIFATEEDANAELERIRRKKESGFWGGERPKTECRAYYHPPCNGWHLTSQPKRSPIYRGRERV